MAQPDALRVAADARGLAVVLSPFRTDLHSMSYPGEIPTVSSGFFYAHEKRVIYDTFPSCVSDNSAIRQRMAHAKSPRIHAPGAVLVGQ